MPVPLQQLLWCDTSWFVAASPVWQLPGLCSVFQTWVPVVEVFQQAHLSTEGCLHQVRCQGKTVQSTIRTGKASTKPKGVIAK